MSCEAMQQHLESFQLGPEVKWEDVLALNVPLDEEAATAGDDLQREVYFYQGAVAAVKIGLERLDALQIPYKRPADFYAEMVKSDEHMAKIKRKLLHEKEAIAKVDEKRRKQKERKFSKQAKAGQQREKAMQKKATLEAIEQWKAMGGEQTEATLETAVADALNKKRKREREEQKAQRLKRQRKEAKFGNGPREERKNSRESTNDISDFSQRRNKTPFSKLKNQKPSKPKTRPGKARRQQMLSKRGHKK